MPTSDESKRRNRICTTETEIVLSDYGAEDLIADRLGLGPEALWISCSHQFNHEDWMHIFWTRELVEKAYAGPTRSDFDDPGAGCSIQYSCYFTSSAQCTEIGGNIIGKRGVGRLYY